MNPNSLLYEVEKNWLSILFDASEACFKSVNLPSHDHWHHYRVWIYAKELIKNLSKDHDFNYNQLTNLIIASFFHDTGMSVTRDEKHGEEGAVLCRAFFRNSQSLKPDNLETALEAIEHHDDKSYKQNKTPKNSLTTILASADDLDAFGYTGIIRYAEIYLLRNIPIKQLSERVTKNAKNRFKNFEENFKNYKDLINRHSKRLNILLEFYNNLTHIEHNRKIIEHVNRNIIQNKPKNLSDLLFVNKNEKDELQDFRDNLNKELSFFTNSQDDID
jgi:hypothetical protein